MKLSTRIANLEALFKDVALIGVVTFKDGHTEKLPIYAKDYDSTKPSIMKTVLWDKNGINVVWGEYNLKNLGMLPQILEYMAEENKKEIELL